MLFVVFLWLLNNALYHSYPPSNKLFHICIYFYGVLSVTQAFFIASFPDVCCAYWDWILMTTTWPFSLMVHYQWFPSPEDLLVKFFEDVSAPITLYDVLIYIFGLHAVKYSLKTAMSLLQPCHCQLFQLPYNLYISLSEK